MKLRAEFPLRRHRADVFGCQQLRFQTSQPDPLDAIHPAGGLHRINQPKAQVLAVGRKVDAHQDCFPISVAGKPFQFGAVEYDYMNGKRMGIDTMAFVEYVGDPATGEEEMISLRPFETVEEILAK